MAYIGETAALTTAVLWSFTSLFFTAASLKIGSYHLNKIRIPVAAVFLAAMLLILPGQFISENISLRSYLFLISSGIIGLTLGDLCLFSAFVILGTRKTLLVVSSTPIITTAIAWVVLGEKLSAIALGGILIIIAGIWWVIAERQIDNHSHQQPDNKTAAKGIFLALGGAAGQAIGLVLAKAGMGDMVAPLNATFIRMLAATAAIWLIGMFLRDNIATMRKIKDWRLMLLILGGSICGPFLGVWLSLVSIRHTETGIAAALMATVPVLVIPLVIIFYKERVSWRAFWGTIITIGGVALLFLS